MTHSMNCLINKSKNKKLNRFNKTLNGNQMKANKNKQKINKNHNLLLLKMFKLNNKIICKNKMNFGVVLQIKCKPQYLKNKIQFNKINPQMGLIVNSILVSQNRTIINLKIFLGILEMYKMIKKIKIRLVNKIIKAH